MDRLAVRRLCRLKYRLAECGMSVNCGGYIVIGSLKCDGESHLRDHFRRIGANNVGTDKFTVRFIEKELHKTIRLPNRKGLATGLKWELTDLQG